MEVLEKFSYSPSELKEFEDLIVAKLDKCKAELNQLKESIKQGSHSSGNGNIKAIEDNADAMEKEHLNQLAARTQKFMIQLEYALMRIKNGTYGVCIDTGKLIPKERLRAVPHTRHCIEAKLGK